MIEILEKELLNELKFEYARSSGPGGQKVNKTASKVRLRWSANDTEVFTEEKKEKIKTYLRTHRPSLITKEDEVIIECDEERYQPRNKEIVIRRFFEFINQALKKEKPRKETKPSKAAKERRLEEKRRKSELKKARQKIKYY